MNSQKSFIKIFIFITTIFLSSGSILAQHQHGNNSPTTEMKEMGCCKNMNHSKHEMNSKENEVNDEEKIDLGKMDMNNDGKVYQCSMCSDQLSDEQGKCAKCGMNLEEVSIEDAQKSLGKKGHDMTDHSKKMNHEMKMGKDMHHDMKMELHTGMGMDSTKSKDQSIVREGKIDLIGIDENKDGKVYQDMMDWNVISDEDGECPLCGMKLKEVNLKKAKKNLVKHGFEVKK